MSKPPTEWQDVLVQATIQTERAILLAAAIERVRELHYEYPDTGDCAGCNHIYPCPTIKALDGEQE